MASVRLEAVVRVLLFYLTALLLLLFPGFLLQVRLGLPGTMLMQVAIFLALPILFTARLERQPLKPFLRLRMLTGKGLLKALVLGAISWVAAQMLTTAILLLVTALGGTIIQPYQILLDAPSWLALLAGALTPAICEEISFRGYILGALRPLGPTAAVILTGLLFGAMHSSLIRLIPLSLLGMLWAMVVQRSGSILPGMVMHLVNNGIALGLSFLAQGQGTPADLEQLADLPNAAIWIAACVLGAIAAGLGTVAYFVAASFSHGDLARPEEAAGEEAALVRPEPPAQIIDPDAPGEVRALQAELASLRLRRRRTLQAAAAALGILTLGIYGFAAWRELSLVFQ